MTKALREAIASVIAGIVFIGAYLAGGPSIQSNPYGWIVWGTGAVLLIIGIIGVAIELSKQR